VHPSLFKDEIHLVRLEDHESRRHPFPGSRIAERCEIMIEQITADVYIGSLYFAHFARKRNHNLLGIHTNYTPDVVNSADRHYKFDQLEVNTGSLEKSARKAGRSS
jgi:hypothetical protein